MDLFLRCVAQRFSFLKKIQNFGPFSKGRGLDLQNCGPFQGRRQDFRRGGGGAEGGGGCRDLPKKLTIQTSARLS